MENALTMASPTVRSASAPPESDLDAVIARYLDPVYSFLYRRVGNREDAEDLTSEVFLRAARQIDPTRPELSVARWLFTVARTVLADHWRKYYQSGASVPLDEEMEHAAEESPVEEPSDASMQMLQTVLTALPDRYRQVLELRFLRSYSIQETAREMGVTPENAKVLQHRALARAVQIAEGSL